MANNKPSNIKALIGEVVDNITVGSKEEFVSVVGLLLHNLASEVVPGYTTGAGTLRDYYNLKVNKRRQEEVDSFLNSLDSRLQSVELDQQAIKYFEDTIVFQLEEIARKLLVNPGRGFDDVIAEFVANALSNVNIQPDTKDLILSTLLRLDSVDLLVLKTMDAHFISNLPKQGQNGAIGVTRDSVCTLLRDHEIDEVVIDRSIQRLQSESLIQPMKISSPMVTEALTTEELYKGKRPDQYDSPGGFVNTSFGRVFIEFLRLSDAPQG